jgi:NADPH2:quinone reductase
MRAAYYERNGSAREVLQVGDVPTPRPGPGDVRVKLVTSGVNPSDVKSRQGATRKIAFPRVIPHSDGAGVIDDVGDGVPKSRIGERVWVWNGQWKRAFGTAAEFIVLPAAQAVTLPGNVTFDAGACLGIPAMTAIHAVVLANVAKDTTLLVSGGAGAVSQYVIQFAKTKGAKVITTVSSPEKAKAAREAGADHTVDYKRENVGERVMEITARHGVDTAIEMDLTTNANLIPKVLRAKGSVIVYGTGPEAVLPAAFCLVNSIRLQFFLVYELDATERERAIAAINDALKTGTLLNRVAQPAFSLTDIAAAHEAVERGTIGNVVMTF